MCRISNCRLPREYPIVGLRFRRCSFVPLVRALFLSRSYLTFLSLRYSVGSCIITVLPVPPYRRLLRIADGGLKMKGGDNMDLVCPRCNEKLNIIKNLREEDAEFIFEAPYNPPGEASTKKPLRINVVAYHCLKCHSGLVNRGRRKIIIFF